MQAQQAIDWLDQAKWKTASAKIKLDFLKQIQDNIETYSDDLLKSDCEMKGLSITDNNNAHQIGTALQSTIMPIASNVTACIDLYESLIKHKMPAPLSIKKIGGDLYDVLVFPIQIKDKILYGDRKDYLRIKGKPYQTNPLEKEGGIIAILSAGNYSSPFEIVRALFIENCVATHKPHPINEKSNAIWEKIFKPLIDYKAVSFCDANDGKALINDKRLKKIYFTGGAQTAKAIMAETDTEIVSECGGNNPCLIVPGDQPWTDKQIARQANFIATFGKLNGGAVCARPQTLVTCKNWPQRQVFFAALENALKKETPGTTSYYPNADKVFAKFCEHYPSAKIIKSKDQTISKSDFLLIKDVEKDGFATNHEAFCQVISEVTLDTAPNADDFLANAVEFCNTTLLGTLSCSILIDDNTQKAHQTQLEKAITDLNYGSIAINTMPLYVWLNPYLTWGGNEKGKEFASGLGNFGNVMCFENVEKSIIYSSFISRKHLLNTNKKSWLDISVQATKYAIRPSWVRLCMMLTTMVIGTLKGKDF